MKMLVSTILLMIGAACGTSPGSSTSSAETSAPPCFDVGDADIPTAHVETSSTESACLAARCTENVQCGDPGRTTCVEVQGPHGLEGIWSCPVGCCY